MKRLRFTLLLCLMLPLFIAAQTPHHIVVFLCDDHGQLESEPYGATIVKRYYERPKEELYDLRNDPFEQHNLATDTKHAKRLAKLRAQLEAWMQANNDSRKIFNKPRPLSDPASSKPAALDEPQK